MSDINLDQDEIRDDTPDEPEKSGARALLGKLPLKKLGGVALIMVTALSAAGAGLVASLGTEETGRYLTSLVARDDKTAAEGNAEGEAGEASQQDVYVKLDEMIVNLPNDRGLDVLKTRIVLKVQSESSLTVNERQPELMDMLQSFMRQLDSTDLRGSMGIFRIKTEILRRGNLLFDGNPITEVLLVEMIAQ